ncbi:hypothetical protein QUF79_13920 [Fictibacillus enclensis]|nr:hypothetical protein [Fictibacillus enclensis]
MEMKGITSLTLYSGNHNNFSANDRIMLFVTKFHLKTKQEKWLTLRRLMNKNSGALAAHILISSEYRRDFPELLEDDKVRNFYLDLKQPKKQTANV